MKQQFKKFFASLALLSVELLIVLLLFLCSFIVFIYVVFRVFYFKKDSFDFAVFDYLKQYVSDPLTSAMQVITFLGTHSFLIPANIVLIAYFLFIKKHRWYSIKIPVVALGGLSLMFVLKFIFNRPRPLIPLLHEAKGLSFPSGHALMSFSFYGLLIYLVWQNISTRWVRIVLTIFLLLLILLIGFSRVYLRVHYASDVLAGFAVGIIWLVLSLWVTRKIEVYSKRKIEPELLKQPLTSALLLLAITGIFACHKNAPVVTLPFQEVPSLSPVTAGVIDEASGIADSHINAGFLWVIQDSQQPTALYLLNHNGQHGKKIFIKNVTNRDWEDLAIADGPVAGKKYLYIGETGDNTSVYTDYSIYRMEEPSAAMDTISQVDKINFIYPDGPHDAEAIFIDPSSKDIYIITKRDAQSKVYRLVYPQSVSARNTALYVMDLPYTGVVAAALSSQKELLIKTYSNIYYYKQSSAITDLLKSTYTTLTYQPEPQGEAVTFSDDNTGFFTLSEKAFAPSVSLNFYKRK